MPKPKKIPRAIKTELLDELKKIDPDINKAIEKLLFANLRKGEPEKQKEYDPPSVPVYRDPKLIKEMQKNPGTLKKLANELWPYMKSSVELTVDQAIEDAKRGYR